VRVTYTDGFDGLPVPTPDGERLAWTSNRDGGGSSTGGQIYIADWNHDKAMEALSSAPSKGASEKP
jgi:Tol biopolymer transport system component